MVDAASRLLAPTTWQEQHCIMLSSPTAHGSLESPHTFAPAHSAFSSSHILALDKHLGLVHLQEFFCEILNNQLVP